jgi:hypothetical protein
MSRIFKMSFVSVYKLYIAKLERKGRDVTELDVVIKWLTGFDNRTLNKHLKAETTFEDFFDEATINPNAVLITGTICGVKIQEIEDPLMLKIRYLDKLVDELANGKPITKVLRS